MKTLREAQEYIAQHAGKGVKCPCCGRLAKVYSRPMHATMAVCLIRLYKLTEAEGPGYYHMTHIIEGVVAGWGDFAKLVHWGLIEEKPKDEKDTTRRTSGYWLLTDKGRDFVMMKATVRRQIILFHNEKMGFAGKEITIKDALKKKFNYEEIMSS